VKRLAGLGRADESAVARAEPDFHKHAAVLNDQLLGRRWVTGETLTLADVSLGAWMVHGTEAGYPLAGYPEIARWYATLAALPAWQRTLAYRDAA
jgi:glutathione S-transferase